MVAGCGRGASWRSDLVRRPREGDSIRHSPGRVGFPRRRNARKAHLFQNLTSSGAPRTMFALGSTVLVEGLAARSPTGDHRGGCRRHAMRDGQGQQSPDGRSLVRQRPFANLIRWWRDHSAASGPRAGARRTQPRTRNGIFIRGRPARGAPPGRPLILIRRARNGSLCRRGRPFYTQCRRLLCVKRVITQTYVGAVLG